MLNLFHKKSKNTSQDVLNARAFNFFVANDVITKNNQGETRHYPPATKE